MTPAGKSSSRTQQSSERNSKRDATGPWSETELGHLRQRYGFDSVEDLAEALGKSVREVSDKAAELFASGLERQAWTSAEVERLKAELGSVHAAELPARLQRSAAEIDAKLRELEQHPRNGAWKREETALLKRLYGRRTDRDLARILERSPDSIRRMARRFALAKDKAFLRQLEGVTATRMPRWTAAELERLVELYPQTPNLEIAHQLQRSVKSVVSKAHHMGLKKADERLREMGRENVALRADRG